MTGPAPGFLAVDAAVVETAARRCAAAATGMATSADALRGRLLALLDPSTAVGRTADAARDATGRHIGSVDGLVEALSDLWRTLVNLSSQIAAAQADWTSAVQAAHEDGVVVDPDGSARPATIFPRAVIGADLVDPDLHLSVVRARLAAAREQAQDADLAAVRALAALAGRLRGLAGRGGQTWTEALFDDAALGTLAANGVRLTVDDARVREVAATVTSLIARPGPDVVPRLRAALEALPLTEREAVIGTMLGKTMVRLGGILRALPKGDDRDGGVALVGLLGASVDFRSVRDLQRDLPWFQPDWKGIHHPRPGAALSYTYPPAPLYQDGLTSSDVDQGRLGDCYLLAGLTSIAAQNPDLLIRNIRANPNGTVTVTFYRDGRSVPVTVTPDLPQEDLRDSPATPLHPYAFAQVGPAESPSETWVGVYEKAYASLKGGYGHIEGGNGWVALSEITGLPSDRWNPDHHSAAELRQALDNGFAVTAGTPPPQYLWVYGKDAGTLYSKHEYSVLSVDAAGNVTLRNPWDFTMTNVLSWREFQRSTSVISLVPTR